MKNYHMEERIIIFVLLVCAGKSDSTISTAQESPVELPIRDLSGTNFAASQSGPNPGRKSDTEAGHYFRVVAEMQNQSLISGGKAQFKCKVEGFPMEDLKFTWYKDNKLIAEDEDPRISIRPKSGMSKLQINDVFTADSGLYRCEASNSYRRVATQASLEVSFNRPPPPAEGEVVEPMVPAGKCETYEGHACGPFLTGKYVYIDPYQSQMEVEKSISIALNRITDPDIVSERCQRYAFPALCYFVFPVCDDPDDVIVALRGNKQKPEDRATRLCREDCELLMHDVCKDEFANPDDDVFMEEIAKTANCSQLPPVTARGANCLKVGLPSVVKVDHVCYNDTGNIYRGTQRRSLSGIACKSWPLDYVQNHLELSGGHNFCRNPGDIEDRPWCFIDQARKTREVCDIGKCSPPSSGSELIAILIPSVSIPLLIGCIGAVFFFCCRDNRRRRSPKCIPGKPVQDRNSMQTLEMMLAPKNISKIPHLNSQSLRYTMDLGDGQFGKVYKAQLAQNMNFNTSFPVAVKTLNDGAMGCHVAEFQRETEVFAELQHPNVACLKAIVAQPNRRCMVFEYTNRMDLHEYLCLHSPHSDVGVGAKVPSSASSQASSSLESNDFINMITQVASGMDYLSSRNFIHRDLAARNVLLCQNNILKICNLGVVRDCYLSSYYRSPQGGNMLPIRWMAPESITNNVFSTKTSVWSFGVLVWEMHSYGLQPYCGYSNQEVLDMVARFHLLACPDQCPARVYALMHECWGQDPSARPSFKDIYAKLCGWDSANTTRMTSQLARGIHRQITNIVKENQYGQYPYTDSASSPSYNTPSPPPTYTSVAGHSSGFPTMQQHQYGSPVAPNVSPASQNALSASMATGSSAPVYAGQRNFQEPAQGYSQTGFMRNDGQNFPQRYYTDQSQQGYAGNVRRPPHSNRSTSSCASSCGEYGPVVRPNSAGYSAQAAHDQHQAYQYGAQPQKFHGGVDHPNAPQHNNQAQITQNRQTSRRPLSGVMEDGTESSNTQPSAAIAPHSGGGQTRENPRLTVLNVPAGIDSNRLQNIQASTSKQELTSPSNPEDTGSSTSSSAKAPSCDSGLPVDEDSEITGDQSRSTPSSARVTSPLISPTPYAPKGLRTVPSNKDSPDRNLMGER